MNGHKNIHFMGLVNQGEILGVLKQADILVNAADHDISMKFLDYIKAGRSILATNKKPANFFKHKETAYLTDNIKDGLIELIKNEKLRKNMERNMKSIKIYTWDEVADIHLKFYNNILLKKELEEFETSYYHVGFKDGEKIHRSEGERNL